MKRAREELPALTGNPRWSERYAAGKCRWRTAKFFKSPGPRIVKSLEILPEILDPEIVSFGHKSSATARRL
jgi:hypothetical protein